MQKPMRELRKILIDYGLEGTQARRELERVTGKSEGYVRKRMLLQAPWDFDDARAIGAAYHIPRERWADVFAPSDEPDML